jgi:hypothetical protein
MLSVTKKNSLTFAYFSNACLATPTEAWKFSAKSYHATRHAGAKAERYSSYSLTSALAGSEWSVSFPDRALPPGKGSPVPTVQETGWASEPVWTHRLQEILCLFPGSNPGRPIWLSYRSSKILSDAKWTVLFYNAASSRRWQWRWNDVVSSKTGIIHCYTNRGHEQRKKKGPIWVYARYKEMEIRKH